MRFSEVVQLVSLTYVSNADTDTINEGEPRETFAEKKSILRTEYYQSLVNSLRPTATFIIWTDEYQGETRLNHNGVAYEIIRTFETNDRKLELVCGVLNDVQTNLSRLRDTVEIWHNVPRENSMGKQSPSAELLCTVPADIEYKGGGTGNVDDNVIETINNITVTIRYREGITPDMFLRIDANRYDIRYIEDPFNRHETLMLTVERVVP